MSLLPRRVPTVEMYGIEAWSQGRVPAKIAVDGVDAEGDIVHADCPEYVRIVLVVHDSVVSVYDIMEALEPLPGLFVLDVDYIEKNDSVCIRVATARAAWKETTALVRRTVFCLLREVHMTCRFCHGTKLITLLTTSVPCTECATKADVVTITSSADIVYGVMQAPRAPMIGYQELESLGFRHGCVSIDRVESAVMGHLAGRVTGLIRTLMDASAYDNLLCYNWITVKPKGHNLLFDKIPVIRTMGIPQTPDWIHLYFFQKT